MYGSYGYNAPNPAALIIFMLLALVASLVITVVVYRTYVRTAPGQRFKIDDQATWGPFFNFDILLIEKILKALYIFFAVFTVLSSLAVLLGMLFMGLPFQAFLVMLILTPISVLINEIVLRMGFESSMLKVIIARNTTEIRSTMGGTPAGYVSGAYGQPLGAPAMNPQQAYVAPSAAPAQIAEAPKVCPNCGRSLPAGAKFCGGCGTRF